MFLSRWSNQDRTNITGIGVNLTFPLLLPQQASKGFLSGPWLCNLPLFSIAESPSPTPAHPAAGHSLYSSSRLHTETLIRDSDWEDTMQDRGEGGNQRPRLCPKSKLEQSVLRNCWPESLGYWAQNELMGECPGQRSGDVGSRNGRVQHQGLVLAPPIGLPSGRWKQ